MNGAIEFLTRLGLARLAMMGVVTLALVGFFAYVIVRVSQPAMGVLFSDLSPQDAGAIVRDLDARNVRYETRGDGQTLLVPRSDLARIRMDLAGKGLPAGGGVGYEIFDKGDAFSSTSFVQGINHLRALEGELSRTIRTIGRVQAARVHLVIPERRLFERDRESPRASIVLKLRGELEPGQVRAVRHLVASAVEGLKPERVSIVDERGRLLADGAQSDGSAAGLAADEKQATVERRLRTQVEEIVAGVVGAGRARVQVAAELDLNRVESRSETFDPESRVVRSTQTRAESQVAGNSEGAVSVGNELPGANAQSGAAPTRDASNKNEEVVNYEISRTTRTEVLEGGRVRRLSVAVLLDGIYSRGANGEVAYQPRPQEELDRITALVRTAIGFDRNRGDQVEVVNLRFAEAPTAVEIPSEPLLSSVFNPTKEDLYRLMELGVLALLTIIVLLMVVRPMLKNVFGTSKGGRAVVAAIAGDNLALPAAQPASAAAQMIEIAKITGQMRADSVERIGEMVNANPQETVAVLRNWIHDR
ncbi:MAG TPA: flagellar basal-body MS-ring/collar protein FliF [Beijerinckiaceae bacterium]|nr:flagellar basal-body MS-ring/collar protein FliF [Beijerinckiaceae bacterium]